MFWQYQPLQDALYLIALMGWGLVAFLLYASPGLIGFILKAYQYQRPGSVGIYIARFMPPFVFVLLIDIARAISLSLILLVVALHFNYLPETVSGEPLWRYLGLCFGGMMLLSIFRAMHFALWRYVFMGRDEGKLLSGDYVVLSLLNASLLVFPCLMSLIPEGRLPAMYLTAGILALILLLRLIQIIRRLSTRRGAYVYIFLYLCTHELLPWVYLASAVYIALRGNVIGIY